VLTSDEAYSEGAVVVEGAIRNYYFVVYRVQKLVAAKEDMEGVVVRPKLRLRHNAYSLNGGGRSEALRLNLASPVLGDKRIDMSPAKTTQLLFRPEICDAVSKSAGSKSAGSTRLPLTEMTVEYLNL
jgi:hypothetical protein